MIGLGRMGANMVRRLQRAGHDCVAYDVDADSGRRRRSRRGPTGRTRRRTSSTPSPRHAHIWLMVPAAYVADTIERVRAAALAGRHADRRWQLVVPRRRRPGRGRCRPTGIHYLDVGTSGGVFGLERGYCLMVGGARRRGRRDDADLRRPGARASGPSSALPATPASRDRPSAAGCTAARTAPATSSRWSTTASSTA